MRTEQAAGDSGISLANKRRIVNMGVLRRALPFSSFFAAKLTCTRPHCVIKSLAAMADVSKLIERAEKYLEKGKSEPALAEFRAAIELQPDNEALLQRAADLALSIGKLGLATDMLRRLFAMAVENKQLGSSAVVFRKLQRMKALDPEVVYRYAELCESTSRKDAAEAYRFTYQEFQRLGDPRRSLNCINQAVRL